MTANQSSYSVSRMAHALGVSRGGFHAWAERAPSARAVTDRDLTRRIESAHAMSRQTYGAPRIHAELAEQGFRVGRKRVERLMKAARLRGASLFNAHIG